MVGTKSAKYSIEGLVINIDAIWIRIRYTLAGKRRGKTMKRYLFQGMLLGCILALAIPAWSATITIGSTDYDVGGLDSLIYQTDQTNISSYDADTGETKEQAWVEDVLNTEVSPYIKFDAPETWYAVTGLADGTWARPLAGEPVWFLVKTGSGAGSTGDSYFLFENEASLQYAVINLVALGFPNGIEEFGVISHYSEIGSTSVPEPGTMMLLGSGLVGLAAWGRKKYHK